MSFSIIIYYLSLDELGREGERDDMPKAQAHWKNNAGLIDVDEVCIVLPVLQSRLHRECDGPSIFPHSFSSFSVSCPFVLFGLNGVLPPILEASLDSSNMAGD